MSEQVTRWKLEDAKQQAEAGKDGSSGSGVARRKAAHRFKVEDGRVWRQVERDGGDGTPRKQWVAFCSEINVLALTRNEDGEDWGRLVEVVDRDGTRHRWAVPLSLTAGSGEAMRAELLRLGLELEPKPEAKAWLLDYLISADTDRRARCVSRIGWHGSIYVLPDGAIGADDDCEEALLQSAERPDHAFNVAGSLEEWKRFVAGPSLGNSRLVLSISAAFAAPLLKVAGDDGGGFHFRGASSSGKSTALTVSGSTWGGCPTRGFVRQWRATDNALEGVAALSCDNLLCLDELSQVDPKAAGTSAYMLANGKGKARAGREGQARRVLEWRVLFLSNGEIGLADKIREGGGRIAAGMEVRVIDLRADAGAGMGIFEAIHAAADPASFAQELKRAANTYYGAPGRAFLARVAADLVRCRDALAQARRDFVAAALPDGADGQVRRVADRFALVAAAGEMATAMGLTGWPPGAALEAARRCFQDWMNERGGIGSSEVAEARRRIAEALQMHGSSRFQRLGKSTPDRMVVSNRMGFVKVDGNADDGEPEAACFLFMREPLKDLLAGLDFRAVIKTLMDEGVIVSHNGAPTKVYHIPGFAKKQRLYQIDDQALEGASGDA